jgi:hypothetical protein
MDTIEHEVRSWGYLHDLLLVELPLLGQVVQLIHVLDQHRGQAFIGQSCARWILERISECGDDICRVHGRTVSSHVESESGRRGASKQV